MHSTVRNGIYTEAGKIEIRRSIISKLKKYQLFLKFEFIFMFFRGTSKVCLLSWKPPFKIFMILSSLLAKVRLPFSLEKKQSYCKNFSYYFTVQCCPFPENCLRGAGREDLLNFLNLLKIQMHLLVPKFR